MKLLSSIILLSLALTSTNTNAQYAGVSVINKGIGVTAGILANKVNIQAALTFPIMNLENSNTYSLSAGYQLNITNDEEDNYSFTPSIGAALVKSRMWDSKAVMTVYEQIKLVYGAELGKDAFMGRVFIHANYSDALYYGVGMKVFFKR